jgi:tRNA(His) 5'-end guanylyltransferase
MKFDALAKRMRVFETAHDHSVLPGLFIVVRLDGRSFTRLTKELHDFETPFDPRFRDCMIAALERLMDCGLRAVYGYTQSDEISLLLHREETAFDREVRKLTSILASETAACFSLKLGRAAAFDARISQLPQPADVIDYFRWRQEDATRNALSAHCYWLLRKQGRSAKDASSALLRLDAARKNELLFEHGINFNRLPSWQKRGVGAYWETYAKEGFNPKTRTSQSTQRRRLRIEMELPVKEAYLGLLRGLVAEAGGTPP